MKYVLLIVLALVGVIEFVPRVPIAAFGFICAESTKESQLAGEVLRPYLWTIIEKELDEQRTQSKEVRRLQAELLEARQLLLMKDL